VCVCVCVCGTEMVKLTSETVGKTF